MKKRCLPLLCLLLLCAVMLCACGDSDVPPDFQRASDTAKDGFTLFIPEEWSYNRSSGVVTAYVSGLSTTNLTASMISTAHDTMEAYWQDAEIALREDFPDYALTDGSPTTAVIAQRPAYLYDYTVSYIGVPYRIRQYLILAGDKPSDGMCILTYSASTVPSEATGAVDFDDSLENLDKILSVFRLDGTVVPDTADKAVADADAPEGMKRANVSGNIGMDVYVPNDWTVTLSDGFISAVAPDGTSNIGLSKVGLVGTVSGNQVTLTQRMEHYGLTAKNESGYTLEDYWALLRCEYGDFYTDFTVTEEPVLSGDDKTLPTVSGESTGYRFSFTGTHGGQTYAVTLYVFRETVSSNPFTRLFQDDEFRMLVYTSTPDNHATYLDTVGRILAEVRF